MARVAVEISDEGDPVFGNHLIALTNVLTTRFHEEGGFGDRDEAIQLSRRAADLKRRTGQPDSEALFALGLALVAGTSDPQNRETVEGLRYMHQAVDATPAGSVRRITDEMAIASAYYDIFVRTRDIVALDEAISSARRPAVARARGEAPFRPAMTLLGGLLLAKFQATADSAALAESAKCYESLAPSMASDDAMALSGFSNVRLCQYQHGGDPAHLQAAVDLKRAAAAILDGDTSHRRAGILAELCNVLLVCYERSGGESDLTDAIEAGREAVGLAEDHVSSKTLALMNLGVALITFANADPRVDDSDDPRLQEAVEVTRRALTACPPESPTRVWIMSNLALLLSRLVSADSNGGLDEAVDLARQSCAGDSDSGPAL